MRHAVIAGRGRIKLGASITHDHRVSTWPSCCPPPNEYSSDEDYRYRAKNPDMIFDVVWNKEFWTCKADGYGLSLDEGAFYGYGCGAIRVSGFGGVELICGRVELI